MDDQVQENANVAGLQAQPNDPAAPQVQVQPPAAEIAPPAPEDVAAKRNAENLQRALAHGYVPEPAPSLQERAVALLAEMQHAVDHNAPITQAMLAEARVLIGALA